MTEQEWINQLAAAGFQPQNMSSNRELYKLADEFWQLRIRAGDKTLYFVHAYVYYEKTHYNGNTAPFSVMFEVPFYLRDSDMWFSVTANSAVSVEKALKFFSSVYKRMECVPDLHNNDD